MAGQGYALARPAQLHHHLRRRRVIDRRGDHPFIAAVNGETINPSTHTRMDILVATAERVPIDLVGQSVGSSKGGPGEPTFS